MRAIGLAICGSPDVLRPVDLPDPHPAPGEVRIQVRATAVAPVDAVLRTGMLTDAYSGLQPPFVPGMEVAGVVDETGPGIDPGSDPAVGATGVAFVDFTGAHCGYSDYVVLPTASVTRAPEGATFPEAEGLRVVAVATEGNEELGRSFAPKPSYPAASTPPKQSALCCPTGGRGR